MRLINLEELLNDNKNLSIVVNKTVSIVKSDLSHLNDSFNKLELFVKEAVDNMVPVMEAKIERIEEIFQIDKNDVLHNIETLNDTINTINNTVLSLKENSDQVKNPLDNIGQKLSEKLYPVEQNLSAVQTRLDIVDTMVNKTVEIVESYLGDISSNFSHLNGRFDKLEGFVKDALGPFDKKWSAVQKILDIVDNVENNTVAIVKSDLYYIKNKVEAMDAKIERIGNMFLQRSEFIENSLNQTYIELLVLKQNISEEINILDSKVVSPIDLIKKNMAEINCDTETLNGTINNVIKNTVLSLKENSLDEIKENVKHIYMLQNDNSELLHNIEKIYMKIQFD